MDEIEQIGNPEVTDENIYQIWDNSKRAKYAIIILSIVIGLALIALYTGYNELQILEKIKAGEYITDEEANKSDLIQGIVGIIQSVIYIISIVVFLNWFRRAYGNLHRVGITHIKHKENMALWAWFIPIIWFFRPFQIMSEIWTKTQEKLKVYDSSYIIQNGTLAIGLWWALFISSNFIGKYVLQTILNDNNSINQLIENAQAIFLTDILQIPEGLLLIYIIYVLSTVETKLAKEIQKQGGEVVFKR